MELVGVLQVDVMYRQTHFSNNDLLEFLGIGIMYKQLTNEDFMELVGCCS